VWRFLTGSLLLGGGEPEKFFYPGLEPAPFSSFTRSVCTRIPYLYERVLVWKSIFLNQGSLSCQGKWSLLHTIRVWIMGKLHASSIPSPFKFVGLTESFLRSQEFLRCSRNSLELTEFKCPLQFLQKLAKRIPSSAIWVWSILLCHISLAGQKFPCV